MSRPTPGFNDAATQDVLKPRRKRARFPVAYDSMMKTINRLLDTTENLNAVEPELRKAFKTFLKDTGNLLAEKNFDALLKEKSGEKFFRNDGTVSWYHEFLPLLMIMSMIRKGARGSGFDIKDIDAHGGMEVLLSTHLRHDSGEDHKSFEELRAEFAQMVLDIKKENPDYDLKKGFRQAEQSLINIDLMTQKRLCGPDGVPLQDDQGKDIKEDVVDYTHNMVESPHANPIVFMLKQADIIHNFATMFGANKFDPARRLKRCNERENMYGARFGFTDIAIEKWRPFSKAIKSLDGMMGQLLYSHFRYLESIENVYAKSADPFRRVSHDYRMSSRFLRGALSIDLPEKINPLHEFMRRMASSVDPVRDPSKHALLTGFIEKVIKPSLERYKDRFPYMFKNQQGTAAPAPAPAPSPVAMR